MTHQSFEICDSCLDAALYTDGERLSPDFCQAACIEFGAMLPDHTCAAVETDGEEECHCGCRD